MKHYNVTAQQGITDLEVCSLMGIDPMLANTPEINTVAITKIYERNLIAEKEAALEAGMSIQEANKIALSAAEEGKAETIERLDARMKATGNNYMEF
jgi:hypothetical protein